MFENVSVSSGDKYQKFFIFIATAIAHIELVESQLKELNWLHKHMKNLRSSQPCIWMNFVLNSVMHKFFHVSVVKWSTINQSALFNLTWSRILSLLRDSLLLGTGYYYALYPHSNLYRTIYLKKLSHNCLSYNKNCQGTNNCYLKFLIFLTKLMASLSYPVLFKCNPLLVKQFPPISLLSTTSIFKVSRWSYTLGGC